ncbi:MAG: MFS transporter [Gammaproteobacteria bacterium]
MLTIDKVLPENRIDTDVVSLRAWLVCLTAALFFFYEFIQMNLFNAISTSLLSDLALDSHGLAKLSSYYFYANLFFLFPAGLILDRFSTRKIILSSMLICILGTFLFGLSTNFYLAALFRFLTGIGSAFCFLSSIRLASRWFPAKRMALISGVIVTMAMFGGFIAQTPMTKLAETVGWRHAMFVDASLGLLFLLFIWLFVKDYPSHKNYQQQESQSQLKAIGFFRNLQKAYLNIQNWISGLYTCFMNMPISILGALIGQLYLVQVYHFNTGQASYITSMLFIGTMIGSPLSGWFSDYIGLRRLPMILGSCCSLLISLLILYLPTLNFLTLLVLFFSLGFFSSTQIISYPTVAEKNSPIMTASAVSVVSFSVISGYPVSQLLFTWLLDSHWNKLIINNSPIYSPADFHYALFLLSTAFLLALITAMLCKETKCKRIL